MLIQVDKSAVKIFFRRFYGMEYLHVVDSGTGTVLPEKQPFQSDSPRQGLGA